VISAWQPLVKELTTLARVLLLQGAAEQIF